MCSQGDSSNNEKCLFCMGFVTGMPATCLRYRDKACLITNDSHQLYGTKFDSSSIIPAIFESIPTLNNLFAPSINLYFLKAGTYKKNPGYNLYVNTVGNTTNTFTVFSSALAEAMAPYTTITLSSGSYDFTQYQGNYNIINPFDPLTTFQFTLREQRELTIQGAGASLTTLYFASKMILSGHATYMYINSITLSGQKLIMQNCATDSCFYCPTITVVAGNQYFNDRSNPIMNIQNYSYPCNPDTTSPFTPSSSLFINNSVIINFRNKANAIISASKSVSIYNTVLEKLQPGTGGSFISFSCTSNCQYINLTMINLLVTDFNYGYEHTTTIQEGFFLNIKNIGNINITNVNFTYNMAFSCSTCTAAALLSFTSIQGQIVINNCVFSNIYTNSLIGISSVSTSYEQKTFDLYGKRKEFSQVHFSISNTVFSYIYASLPLIYYTMDSIKQNINFINCTFYKIQAGSYGLIYISGTSLSGTSELNGESYYYVSGNTRTLKFLPPRYITLSNIYTNNIQFSLGIVTIKFYSNVIIKNFTNLNSNSGTTSFAFFDVINNFKNANKYLSQPPPSSELTQNSCQFGLDLEYLGTVIINTIYFDSLLCTGLPFSTIFALGITSNFTLTNSKFTNIIGNSFYGLVLHETTVSYTYIDTITIKDAKNGYLSIINIETMYNFSMVNADFTSLYATYFPTISLKYINTVIISNISCNDCQSVNSDGGAISLSMGSRAFFFIFNNGTFNNCNALGGRGGVLLLDSISSSQQFSINMKDIMITNSKAKEGIIRFTNNLNISNSMISNLYIKNSNSVIKGLITDEHADGTLVFNGLYTVNNNAPNSGINGFYQTAITNLIVENAYIAYDTSINSIFYFDSNFANSVIKFFNVTVQKSRTAPGMQISTLQFVGDLVYFDTLSSGITVNSDAVINLTNTIITNIQENAVFINYGTVNCVNCTFSNSKDTLIKGIQNAVVNFTNSLFTQGTSSQASVFYSVNSDSFSNFTSCNFTQNNSTSQGVINLSTAKLGLLNCNIYNNTSAQSQASGIMIYGSTLYVNQSTFANHAWPNIYASLSSFVYVYSSVFKYCSTSADGSAIYLASSTASIIGSTFSHLTSSSSTAGVYATESTVAIAGCSFEYNKGISGDSLYLTLNSRFTIENCSFLYFNTSNQVGTIYFDSKSWGSITNSLFSNSFGNGNGVYGTGFLNLTITSSNFSNIFAAQGGGIALLNGNSTIVSNSRFVNNKASDLGGAIFVSDSSLIVKDTFISNNSANNYGGGIYFKSSNNFASVFNISGLTTISYNKCILYSGGGIQ